MLMVIYVVHWGEHYTVVINVICDYILCINNFQML